MVRNNCGIRANPCSRLILNQSASSMGGFNSHIFARRVSKRVAAADSSKQEAGVVDREHAAAEKPLNGFQVIPEHLVETIFLNLKKSSRRNQFAV